MLYKIAPKSLVFFGILTITIVLFINIYTTLQTPALGIVWEPTQTGDLSIKQIFPNSPAQQAGLPIGQVIVSIGYSDLSEPISVLSITEEPDNLGKYHNAAQFFAHQSLVADIINQNTLWLEAKDGSRYTIQPAPRHFSWLPPMYWFQLACGLLSFFSGMLVFVFRMKDPAARVYLLNGISFTVVTFSAAIYSSRELAIPGDIFKVLSALNHLGSLCFTASFIALAWYIPKKLNDFSITSTLLLLYSLFWLADTFRWQTDSPETWVQLPILFGLFSSIIIATIQWRKCKQRHDDKQALRWLLLSLLVPGIVFLCLTIVLQWLGIELIVPQGYSFGVLLIMYLGISLGVIRFALFELDKWWASIWLWLFTGIFFIAVDILLATTLHLSETTSTLLSLVIIGFIYIPVRQKVFLRILKTKRVSLESLIPQVLSLVTHVNNNPHGLEKKWQDLLKQAFDPLSIHKDKSINLNVATLKNNGVALYVPNIGISSSLILEYPNQGTRLFSNADVTVLTSLIQMVKRALEDSQLYQKGITEERMRIAEDLHDDLGAKLLSLVYKSETSEQKQLAKQAMGALREVISATHEEQVLFVDQVLDWKNECMQRTSESQVQLRWKQYGVHPKQKIPVNISIHLSKILREAMSNALKHGNGEKICVHVHVRKHFLFVSVRNYGITFCEPNTYKSGIANMKRRVKNIGGIIRWINRKDGGCHVAWVSPVMEGLSDS